MKEGHILTYPQNPLCTAGIPIKSTMDNSSTMQYAGLMHNLIMKARGTVRDIDPQNDLTFLRIRSKKNEIMVAPGKKQQHIPDEQILLIIIISHFDTVSILYHIPLAQ